MQGLPSKSHAGLFYSSQLPRVTGVNQELMLVQQLVVAHLPKWLTFHSEVHAALLNLRDQIRTAHINGLRYQTMFPLS